MMSSPTRTSKAAILLQTGRPLEIGEVALPEALGYGQVLVRVHFSTICGSQLGEIDGVKGADRFLPHLLGHEGSGTVEAVGPGVHRVHGGEHVVLHWMKASGIEAETPKYQRGSQIVNAGWVTTFNEWAVVSENRLTPISPDLDLSLAPLFGCAVTTGLGVLMNDAKLRVGESVVVFGAGGVGLNVIQGASLSSGYPIVAVDLYDDKLALAKRLGATDTVNAKSMDVRAEIAKRLGKGADVVVETTGNPGIIELAYEVTNPQGRMVLVGVPDARERIRLNTLPLHFGKMLMGSHGGGSQPEQDIPRYAALHQAGKLLLHDLITARVRLEDINDAMDAMRRGAVAGRCLIDMAPRAAALDAS